MIMIVISFALVKFYAFAILYVLIVMQIKLVVVVVVETIAKKFEIFGSHFQSDVFLGVAVVVA